MAIWSFPAVAEHDCRITRFEGEVVAKRGNRSVGPCRHGPSVVVDGRNAQSSVVLAHQTKRRTGLRHSPTERIPGIEVLGIPTNYCSQVQPELRVTSISYCLRKSEKLDHAD